MKVSIESAMVANYQVDLKAKYIVLNMILLAVFSMGSIEQVKEWLKTNDQRISEFFFVYAAGSHIALHEKYEGKAVDDRFILITEK